MLYELLFARAAAKGGGSVYGKLEAGVNISIEETSDGKAKISATGEVSSEDSFARAEIEAIKDGISIDSFADVESALNDKADTTDIPTVNDSTITIQKNGVAVDSFTTNAATGKTINITVPTTAADVNALPDTTKYGAALSLTIDSSTYVVTAQLKDQNGDNLGQAQTIDLPLESVVVSGSYNSQTKKVVLTLQSGSTVEFSVSDLVAGLQSEITANNKLSSDLVDDTNATHKFVSASEKTTWNSKQDALSQEQMAAVNSGATAAKIDQIETNHNAVTNIISNTKNKFNYTIESLKKMNTSGTWTDNQYVYRGVTFTINPDYTISATGTASTSQSANLFLFMNRNIGDFVGDILSGCPQTANVSIRIEQAASPWGTIAADTGSSAVIGSSSVNCTCYINVVGSVSGAIFEPMICDDELWELSNTYTIPTKHILKNKKIVYNGDSICESRLTGFSANGGAYAKLIADETGCFYENRAVSGGTLAVVSGKHNICTDVTNMASDADLVCFEGGINDYWNNVPLGTYSETEYASSITGLDTSTVCGALEAIIRQAIARWTGVPICFVIVHKITGTAYTQNSAGYTFAEMREKMIGILNKYSIPYYDCYEEGGLNGYMWYLNNAYLNGGASEHPDGCHPDEGGYRRYYVPQLIDLFTRIMPVFK